MKTDQMLGIIGWPVNHSLSPQMQNQALKHCGLNNWLYVAIPVEKNRIEEVVLGLRALSFRGVNITVPHKEAVLPLMDSLSDAAREIGAVNTVVIEPDGALVGHNTDAQGFINDLLIHDIKVGELSAVILGAGGSAKAVAYGLLKNGCKKLTICNRNIQKAKELSEKLAKQFNNIEVIALPLEFIKQAKYADLIINCTSFGMDKETNKTPFLIDFNSNQIVYDLIYEPKKTMLLKKAEANGARAINGLGMLLHQGALSFTLWTKLEAPVAVMKSALNFKA